ncbi:hypothetical protein GCM10011316_04130 [Roseibium aquae]|uniref:Uncharacterized protein n=1 Tax=Roseibium aquae TaxID=1323746 RepID=A0A916TAG8_9HYPH|nr:hypothetical protein GCM10011316_04130 [Roseibium aquae]
MRDRDRPSDKNVSGNDQDNETAGKAQIGKQHVWIPGWANGEGHSYVTYALTWGCVSYTQELAFGKAGDFVASVAISQIARL